MAASDGTALLNQLPVIQLPVSLPSDVLVNGLPGDMKVMAHLL